VITLTGTEVFDGYLRNLKDLLLAPVARALGSGISPTTITCIAFVAGLGCVAAILVGSDGVALALWIGNRVLDGLDGTQARVHRRDTHFGAYIDIVLDFIVYAAIPTAMAARHGSEAVAFAGMVLVGAFYVNAASWMYLAALLEQRHLGAAARGESTTIAMPEGVIGGAETVGFYVAFFLWPAQQRVLFLTMAALVLLNVVIRLVWARRILS
jgi:phosphatidylglycerophosphate synthase